MSDERRERAIALAVRTMMLAKPVQQPDPDDLGFRLRVLLATDEGCDTLRTAMGGVVWGYVRPEGDGSGDLRITSLADHPDSVPIYRFAATEFG